MSRKRRRKKKADFTPAESNKACVSCRVMFWGDMDQPYCRPCLALAKKTSRIITDKRREARVTEDLDRQQLKDALRLQG